MIRSFFLLRDVSQYYVNPRPASSRQTYKTNLLFMFDGLCPSLDQFPLDKVGKHQKRSVSLDKVSIKNLQLDL